MCGITVLKNSGIVLAVFAILISMGTEGFFAWKVYEINNVNITLQEDLEIRSYIGLGEGILGTFVSICFAIGFGSPALSLIWLWVIWALGISSYNSYCIYDFHEQVIGNSTTFPWDTFLDDEYGVFFLEALCSVSAHLFIVLIALPIGGALTSMYWKGNVASYDMNYGWDNDVFEMD